MAETKNLCAQIDLALHTKVSEEKEKAGQTTSQYIAQLLTEYYEMKENGGITEMSDKGRTMAFQIPEELFQRIKRHLEHESARLGRKVTQREFVLGLIESALAQAEAEEAAAQEAAAQEHEDSITPDTEQEPAQGAENAEEVSPQPEE